MINSLITLIWHTPFLQCIFWSRTMLSVNKGLVLHPTWNWMFKVMNGKFMLQCNLWSAWNHFSFWLMQVKRTRTNSIYCGAEICSWRGMLSMALEEIKVSDFYEFWGRKIAWHLFCEKKTRISFHMNISFFITWQIFCFSFVVS